MTTVETPVIEIDSLKLMERLDELGDTGRDSEGQLTRLAASDADKAGRDLVSTWMREAGLAVSIDAIGNIVGYWPALNDEAPLMIGSHIDTVINAGKYDGCYGVLSGLSVIEACQKAGFSPSRPIAVAVFTNEEGARYSPDMMGSLVYAGGLRLNEALASQADDGTTLGEELERISYAGDAVPGRVVPYAFLEVHIEQGPILEKDGTQIGAVENLQGISWQSVTISGVANHAGTTPIHMRHDAGLAAAKVITFLREYVTHSTGNSVATVGTLRFSPNAINVVPAVATFTVDLRDPDEMRLRSAEKALDDFLAELRTSDGVTITTERLARFEPVTFDEGIVQRIEQAAAGRGLSHQRMTSGAGHDAQMMSRICPSAMIFVPSKDGISHNPREHTDAEDLIAGANVLLDLVVGLTS